MEFSFGHLRVIIGGILILATLGTVYSYGNLAPYIVSYLRQRGNPNLGYKDASWIYTGHMIGMSIGMATGGYLVPIFGPRNTAWIGSFFMAIFVMLTYYTADHFLGVFLTYGLLFGIGVGTAYSSPMIIGHRWFPDRKNLIAGVLMAGYGLGSSVFNIFQVNYVNPLNLTPDLSPDPNNPREKFFDDESLLSRIPSFYVHLGLIYFACQLIGGLLLANENPPSPTGDANLMPDNTPMSNVRTSRPVSAAVSVAPAVRDNGTWACDSRQFWMLWTVMFLFSLACGFSTSYWKVLGVAVVWADDHGLGMVGVALCIANAAGRLFWGAVADRMKSSRKALALVAVSGALTLASLSPIAARQSTFLFGVWMFLIFFTIGGSYALFPGTSIETFGDSHFAQVYGLLYTSQAFSVLFGAYIHSTLMPVIGLPMMPLLMSAACVGATIILINYPTAKVYPPQLDREVAPTELGSMTLDHQEQEYEEATALLAEQGTNSVELPVVIGRGKKKGKKNVRDMLD